MPISLERIVERELDRRLVKVVFDAWRRLRIRRRVEARWLAWLQYHGYLVRALLRTWAGRPVHNS